MHGVTSSSESGEQIAAAVRFCLPEERLRHLITSYYAVEVSGPPKAAVEDLLHPEWGNLRFQIRSEWHALGPDGRPVEPQPAAVFGPTSRARPILARPGAVLGVGFTPLGWALLIGCPADSVADAVVRAADLLGSDIMRLHEALLIERDEQRRFRLLDRFFGSRVPRQAGREPMIRAIHAALLDPKVDTAQRFAERVGLSQPALARACLRDFGFTPKVLLRRQRFLRTLAALAAHEDQPIGELLDGAYTDHSHFNREFRRFMGMSPTAYLAQPRLLLRAAAGMRERALGAALQGLHALGQTG